MNQIKAFLFGLIQGFSEFLPISSSGHLVLLRTFFDIKDFNLLFILVLHLGTLTAILSYYRKELLNILQHFFLKPFSFSGPGRVVLLIMWATLPGITGAFLLSSLVKKSLLHPTWTGWGFILTATCLFFTSKKLIKKKPHQNSFSLFNSIENWNQFSFSTAFLVGLAQTFAFFPGMSRSGWTIAVALFLGCSQHQAACFSFLLAIPAILGGTLFEFFNTPLPDRFSFFNLSIAFLSAWFFGYIALKWLIHSLQKALFPFFSFYLWPLGVFIICKHFFF
ncbi:MAG: undecaprenyl-diphosphate phosphatase [Bdellovibrionales bacterium]|nr:undecaprenyl-diphosphate phosphatase [Bdellovibrionales bacterium]